MPRLDGTGPTGLGSMTGRGLSYCGRGMGRGLGCWGGYGLGLGFRGFISPKNNLAALEDMEEQLEEDLAAIREEKAALKDQQK